MGSRPFKRIHVARQQGSVWAVRLGPQPTPGARRRRRVKAAQGGACLGHRQQGSCSLLNEPAPVPQPATTPSFLGTSPAGFACTFMLRTSRDRAAVCAEPGRGALCLRVLTRMRGSSYEAPCSLPVPVAGLLERRQPSLCRPPGPLADRARFPKAAGLRPAEDPAPGVRGRGRGLRARRPLGVAVPAPPEAASQKGTWKEKNYISQEAPRFAAGGRGGGVFNASAPLSAECLPNVPRVPPSVSERLRELGAGESSPRAPGAPLPYSQIPPVSPAPAPGRPGIALSETGRIPALRSLAKARA